MFKRIWAEELAAMLGCEWDFMEADDDDLFTALEEMGYDYRADRGWVVSTPPPVFAGAVPAVESDYSGTLFEVL